MSCVVLDSCKMCVINEPIWSATSFWTLTGSLSGPVALLGFKRWSCFAITFSSYTMLGMDEKGEGPLLRAFFFSMMKMKKIQTCCLGHMPCQHKYDQYVHFCY